MNNEECESNNLNQLNDNLVELENKRIKYRFLQETCKIAKKLPDGNEKIEEFILIMIEQKKEGKVRRKPHPLSEFLIEFKNHGISEYDIGTLKLKAAFIVKFLNFTFIANENNIDDVMDLTFEHATNYLNNYSYSGVQKETVERCENVLKDLYYFLAKRNVLKNITLDDFDTSTVEWNGYIKIVIHSPFRNAHYPRKTNKKSYLTKKISI